MRRWWECLRNSYSAVASVRDTSPVRCFAGRERLENWQIVLQDTSTTLAVGISLWATHWNKRPRGAWGRSWELWEDQMGRSLESIWVEEGKPQITRISSTPSTLPPPCYNGRQHRGIVSQCCSPTHILLRRTCFDKPWQSALCNMFRI